MTSRAPSGAGQVHVSRPAFQLCLAHCLSSEAQEVMGLLLGSVEKRAVHVEHALALPRKDRRKDRVEVSYDSLTQAAAIAEKLQAATRRPCRVVGWYHSHPHITVQPSHVDVKTQGGYQYLDDSFVGVIFSVFGTAGAGQDSVSLSAFQAAQTSDGSWERREIPVRVTPAGSEDVAAAAQGLLALQEILAQEAMLEHRRHCGIAGRTHVDELNAVQRLVAGDVEIAEVQRNVFDVAFHSGVYTKALALLMQDAITPLGLALQSQLASLKLKKERLRQRIGAAHTSSIERERQDERQAAISVIADSTAHTLPRTRRCLRQPHLATVIAVRHADASSALASLHGQQANVQIRRSSTSEPPFYRCSISPLSEEFELLNVQPVGNVNSSSLTLRPIGGASHGSAAAELEVRWASEDIARILMQQSG